MKLQKREFDFQTMTSCQKKNVNNQANQLKIKLARLKKMEYFNF